MSPDALEVLYAQLANAIDRAGGDRTPLLLATLALDLIARHPDPSAAAAAIERAERLAGL